MKFQQMAAGPSYEFRPGVCNIFLSVAINQELGIDTQKSKEIIDI